MTETSKEATACLLNSVSFITNSDSVVRCYKSGMDTVADMISLHGAQLERLVLDDLPSGSCLPRLSEAISGSTTISFFSVDCGYSNRYVTLTDPKLIGLMIAALQNKTLRRLTIKNMNLHTEEIRTFCKPLRTCSLTEIRIEHSRLVTKKFISALCRLSALQSLYILTTEFSFSIEEVSALAAAVQCWPWLRELGLHSVGIAQSAGKLLGEALGKGCAGRLQVLELPCNNLGDKEIAAIVDGILGSCRRRRAEETAIRVLDLRKNTFAHGGGLKIAELLKMSPNLERLDVELNPDVDTVELGDSLRTCAGTLRWLSVNVCRLGPKGITSICRSLSGTQKLQNLTIAGTKAGNEGLRAVAEEIVAKGTSLVTLSLRTIGATADGAKFLALALKKSRNPLRSLNLCSNKGIGTAELIESLPDSLQKLELRKCAADDQSAEAIGRFIRQSHCIRRVILGDNDFHAAGIKPMLEAARESDSLKELEVAGNDLGPAGALCVAETIGRCRSLRRLNIVRTHIGSEGAKAIAKAGVNARPRFVQGLSKLQELMMYRSDMGDEERRELQEVKCLGLLIRFN